MLGARTAKTNQVIEVNVLLQNYFLESKQASGKQVISSL